MTAIDVGANFGYYTMLLAALVGEGGPCLRDRAGAGDRGDAAPLGRAQRVRENHDRDRGRGRRRRGRDRRCSRAASASRKTPSSSTSPTVVDRRRRHGAPGRRNPPRRAARRAAPHRLRQDRRRGRRGSRHRRHARDVAPRPAGLWCSNSTRRGRATRTALLGTLCAIYGSAALPRPARQRAGNNRRIGCCARSFATIGCWCSGPLISAAKPISRSSSRRFCSR